MGAKSRFNECLFLTFTLTFGHLCDGWLTFLLFHPNSLLEVVRGVSELVVLRSHHWNKSMFIAHLQYVLINDQVRFLHTCIYG